MFTITKQAFKICGLRSYSTVVQYTNIISIYSRVCDNGNIEPYYIKIFNKGYEKKYYIEKNKKKDYRFENIKSLPVTMYTYN